MESNFITAPEKNSFPLVKAVLSFTPIYFFTSCYVIWFYLNELGRLSLFTTSLQNKYDLFASLISFILLSISFSIITFIPSMLLCQLYFSFQISSFNKVLNVKRIPLIAIASSLSTLIFLSVISWLDYIPILIKDHSFIILFTSLLIISFTLTHLISTKKNKPHYFYSKNNWVKRQYFCKERVATIFMVAFSGATVVFPLSIIFKFGSAYTTRGILYALVLSVLISILSLMPAVFLYSSSMAGRSIFKKLRAMLITSTTIFIFVLFLMPNLVSLLCFGAFKNIGIIDETQHIYVIAKPYYSPSMFPSPVWTHIEGDDAERFYLKGTSLFSLGESVLLCPEFVVETKNKILKKNFDKIFGDNDLSLQHLKTVARSCVPVRKEHIAQWDTIQDTGNKLNSYSFQMK